MIGWGSKTTGTSDSGEGSGLRDKSAGGIPPSCWALGPEKILGPACPIRPDGQTYHVKGEPQDKAERSSGKEIKGRGEGAESTDVVVGVGVVDTRAGVLWSPSLVCDNHRRRHTPACIRTKFAWGAKRGAKH